MKATLLLLLAVLAALVVVALAAPTTTFDPTEDYTQRVNYVHHSDLKDASRQEVMWREWKVRHSRVYETVDEESMRFGLFVASLHRIVAKNDALKARGRGPNHGTNRFSDLAPEEWRATYLSTKVHTPRKSQLVRKFHVAPKPSKDVLSGMPTDLDWNQLGKVSYVKDQGQCGSCWAFSTAETVESAYAMKYGNSSDYRMMDLSEQQIVDCDWFNGNQGCDGGDPATAYQYVMNYGLETEESYPYLSGNPPGINGTCDYSKSDVAAQITAFTYATPPCPVGNCTNQNDVLLAQNLWAHGPTGIIVDASNWQDYTFGTFEDCACDAADMDHGVQLTGYLGYDPKSGLVNVWQVRNSWNTDWGVDGYIWLGGSSVSTNMCGVSNEAIYATAA